jgi:hypothetical protein
MKNLTSALLFLASTSLALANTPPTTTPTSDAPNVRTLNLTSEVVYASPTIAMLNSKHFNEMPTAKKVLTVMKLSRAQRNEIRTMADLTVQRQQAGGKSQGTALLLFIPCLVGIHGIPRFYMGYTWQGVVQLLTFGGLLIWSIIDLVRIANGDLKPKNGNWGTEL